MAIRNFTTVLGIVFLAAGIFGFIPVFVSHPTLYEMDFNQTMNHGLLFGLFPVNALHNLLHIAFGIWALGAAHMGAATSKIFSRSVAVIYTALAVLGLFPATNTLFGLSPLYSHDIWLHAGIALMSAYYGFVWDSQWAHLHIHKDIHPGVGVS